MNPPINQLSNHISQLLLHFGVKLNENTVQTIAQAIGFALVGLSNTMISYLLYVGTLLLMHALSLAPHYDYLIAQAISFTLSVLWSYWWNSRFVFGARGIGSLIRTYASYSITGLFISTILLVFWIQIIGISEYVAPILNLLITVPLNFLLNKFWAFRK